MEQRMAECHNDKPHLARGLCRTCYDRSWWSNRKEWNRERVKKYRTALQPEERKHLDRKRNLSKYGLSPDDYQAMVSQQEGCCAICKGPPDTWGVLVVDHDHTTGVVRGLLCNRCNRVLGMMNDDVSILESATKYLTRRGDHIGEEE